MTAIAAAGLLLLGGCGQPSESDQAVATASDAAAGTVAAAVAGSVDHRKLAGALTDTQLAPVLDGTAEYTLLAPSDAAFEAMGAKTAALTSKEERPLMIALLRGHILPGQVAPKSVEAAIARKQGPVTMRTMAGNTVTFAKSGEGLTVTAGSGTARLAAASTAASNGAVLSIDKVLMPKP